MGEQIISVAYRRRALAGTAAASPLFRGEERHLQGRLAAAPSKLCSEQQLPAL